MFAKANHPKYQLLQYNIVIYTYTKILKRRYLFINGNLRLILSTTKIVKVTELETTAYRIFVCLSVFVHLIFLILFQT